MTPGPGVFWRIDRRASAVAAVVYAAVVLVAPVSHAATELPSSDAALESAHSDGCARLHGGSACNLLGSLQLALPLPTAPAAASGAHSDAASAAAPHTIPGPTDAVPPPARAPPRH